MSRILSFGRSKPCIMRFLSLVVAAGLAAAMFLSLFHIQQAKAWSTDPMVNTPINASGQAVDQVAISDGYGGAIIVWATTYPGSIYAQRVESTGALKWATNGVAVCTAAGHQGGVRVTTDGSGGAIIAWHDYRSGSFESDDIYAQRVDRQGVTQWATNGIAICTAAGHKLSSGITSDGSGGAIVAWENQQSGSNSDVYAQRVTGAGIAKWTDNGTPICTAAGFQSYPAVVGDGSSGAIITWEDNSRGGIYAQRVGALGTVQWASDGVPVCTAAGNQTCVRAIRNSPGGAIIAWQDGRSGEYRAYAQRIDSSGTSLWSDNGVAVCTAAGRQEQPVITSSGSGSAIVTWEDRRNGNSDCYAQKIDPTGVLLWSSDGVAICMATGDQWCIRVEGDGLSGAIITWEDRRNGDDAVDIYAQRVNANGVPQWADDGLAVCSASSIQFSPTITDDGFDGAIVSWLDRRDGGANDIYAQRTSSSGHLGSRPNQPENLSPANFATGVGLTPTLRSSGFSDVDAGDTHSHSQWQITAAPGSYSSPVFDSQAVSVNLTNMAVPSDALAFSTTYFWHVRYQDNHGDWSAWSTETSFTTINQPPSQPMNASPGSAADGIELTPTLQASPFSDPEGDAHTASHWQVRTSSGGYSSPVFDSQPDGVNLTNVAVPSGTLAFSTTYFWHVRYQDNHGDWSTWSEETSFTTVNQPPSQPMNASPSSAAAGIELTPTLQASPFSDPDGDAHTSSHWQVRASSGSYSSPVFDSQAVSVNLTNMAVPSGTLAFSTTYFWHVRYQDNHGDWSTWSEETSFTTINQPPSQPMNASPSSAAAGIELTPTLQASPFSDPDGDAHTASHWQVRASSGGYSSPVFDSQTDGVNLTNMTVPSDALAFSTTYFWHVRYQDNHGDWSAWSTETSFATQNRAPDRPANTLPTTGATTVSVTPTLQCSAFSDPDTGDSVRTSQWRIAASAGDYANPAFDSTADASSPTQIAVPAGKLNGNTAYFWQVRHQDNHGDWSDWSAETSFTTQNRVPDRPSVASAPGTGATGMGIMPILQSSAFSDPDKGDSPKASQWRIATTVGDYSSPVFDTGTDSANLVELTVPSGTLRSGTTYYWQVRHQDSHGDWSAWSEEASFTTQANSKAWIWIVVGAAAAAVLVGSVVMWLVLGGKKRTTSQEVNPPGMSA